MSKSELWPMIYDKGSYKEVIKIYDSCNFNDMSYNYYYVSYLGIIDNNMMKI